MSRLEEERKVFKEALKSVDNWDALATTLGCYPGMLEKRVEELEEENEALAETRKLDAVENVRLWEENQRYKQALEEIRDNVTWDNAEDATYNAYQESSKALEESE